MKKFRLDLASEIKKLEIVTRSRVGTRFLGRYSSVFRGRGLEFQEYRNYNEGDDAHLIDWKASARSNNILVKEFTEERDLNVFFLVDVSGSMVFGSTKKLKMEYAAEIVGTLAHIVLESNDRVGYGFFSSSVVHKLLPSKGPQVFYKLSKALVDPRFYGGGCDLGSALDFALDFLSESAIGIIVSDFVGLSSGWESKLGMASKKFDIIAFMVRDPRDTDLGDEQLNIVLENPASDQQLLVDTQKIAHSYRDTALRQQASVREEFLKSGSDFVTFSTATPFVTPMIRFFKYREARWG